MRYVWPTKERVRFYMFSSRPPRAEGVPTTYPPSTFQARYWAPLHNDTCIVAPNLGTGCQFLRTIVGNFWDAAPIWHSFPSWKRSIIRDYEPPPGVVVHPTGELAGSHVTRTPPPGCVCVAIAFYPDPEWVPQYANPTDAPAAVVRDIRVFVGNEGIPEGPRFGELEKQDDDLLADGTVLRLAALSAVG